MRIVLTGSAGRVGRAIYSALAGKHEIVGVDRQPFSTVKLLGDFTDREILSQALDGADAVMHVAALHAPHVAAVTEQTFYKVNVEGTRLLAEMAMRAGVRRMVFTSTTALFGDAIRAGSCRWITEDVEPLPRTIYHRTKLAAEESLLELASPEFTIRILRMGRSFPEPADVMALYRLHRGIDIRDVAEAHAAALGDAGAPFERCIVSGLTPFQREDCEALASDPEAVLKRRMPRLVEVFKRRGWPFPAAIDRVYDCSRAMATLGWRPRYGFEEVLAQLERRSLEVLPA